jgi:hypothetical protein
MANKTKLVRLVKKSVTVCISKNEARFLTKVLGFETITDALKLLLEKNKYDEKKDYTK